MKSFFLLYIDRLEVNADGQAYYGTKYQMEDACPKCGTGAVAIGARYMSGLKKGRRGLFKAGYGELLIEEKLAKKLIDMKIDGLFEVYSARHLKMPFMEIRGEGCLPPFSPKTTGYTTDEQCPVCKRNGFFDTSKENIKLVYENLNENLLKKNILITYERFGYSKLRTPFKESGFAHPKFIISEKIKEFFEKEKVRGLDFEPVTIL